MSTCVWDIGKLISSGAKGKFEMGLQVFGVIRKKGMTGMTIQICTLPLREARRDGKDKGCTETVVGEDKPPFIPNTGTTVSVEDRSSQASPRKYRLPTPSTDKPVILPGLADLIWSRCISRLDTKVLRTDSHIYWRTKPPTLYVTWIRCSDLDLRSLVEKQFPDLGRFWWKRPMIGRCLDDLDWDD